MDFAYVLERLWTQLEKEGITAALIGGFALAALGATRATTDLDLLVSGERADDVHRLMQRMGYKELHRSQDAANYAAEDERLGRVDFLFARRHYSTAMLARAKPRSVAGLQIKVVEAEDVIGLKVQSSSNNPKRLRLDLADIERLLQANPDIELALVREYFALFDRENELDEILVRMRS